MSPIELLQSHRIPMTARDIAKELYLKAVDVYPELVRGEAVGTVRLVMSYPGHPKPRRSVAEWVAV